MTRSHVVSSKDWWQFVDHLPDGGSHSDAGAAIQYVADEFGLLLGG